MSSTSYPSGAQDWRGRFIADLATALSKRRDLNLALWSPPGEMPEQVVDATDEEEKAWLQQLSDRGGIAHLLREHKLQSFAAAGGLLHRLRKAYSRHEADLVHVNWLQNALPLWGTKTPAVVSVLGSDFGLLRLPGMRYLLRAVFRQRRTILAPNADWMVGKLTSLFGDVAEICAVPFGVEKAWFDVRREPPLDGMQHWLAITRLTRNKVGNLFNWGQGLFNEKRKLHLFGPMQEQMTIPPWVHYHGPTHPAELLSTWFPFATGLITLSRHDEGRPQVMLEAMAAGLPIIASDLPAHRSIIKHGQTGWLAASPTSFEEALTELENTALNEEIGTAERNWIKQEIGTWDDCAARYVDLYVRLMESKP